MVITNVLKHAENILRAFEIEPRPLDRMIDAYYRRNRNLGSKERQLISGMVFGVMRWRRRLDGVLLLGGVKKIADHQRIAAYVLWKGPDVEREQVKGIVGSDLNFDIEPKSFPGGPAAYWSYPDFIYDRLAKFKGGEWAAKIASALNEQAQVCIRTNILKSDRDGLQKLLRGDGIESTPSQFSPFGLVLEGRANFDALSSFKKGFFEVQDEASQLVGLFVNPKESDIIIDVCAGAGGKTLLLAMLMKGEGRIVASDTNIRKLRTLKERAKQAGVKNIEVVLPHKLKEYYRENADVVLIDAPCSGTGTLRRNPDLKWRLNEGDIANCANSQKEILADSLLLVKKGGRLIYVTCSILPDENEEVVGWFKKKFGWEIIGDYFRTDPSEESMDGFFAAILKKP